MFILKKIGCRIFQIAFRAALPILPYREPQIVSSLADLGATCKKEKIKSVLIVTDAGIVKNGLTISLEDVLKENKIQYTLYDKTQPNPTVDNVEEALALYRKSGCDALIAIGGGSAMDCAKAVGARLVYPKKPLYKMKGILRVLRRIPTLIAIPTTAGTGSEVTLAAVITDSEKHHKYTMNNFTFIPRYAVLDPEVTYSLPPSLTATTGMDALTHAVEAYIGRSTTKKTRKMALDATSLIFSNIEVAFKDGKNSEARENMLKAAYLAGNAFSQSYVGYVHAVAHSLGGKYNTPHGLANSVLLPVVLEQYGERVYKKLHRLGVAAGVADETDTRQQGAKKLILAVSELNERLMIPKTLSGIIDDDIPEMARHADKEANPLYPVPVLMNARQLESLYHLVKEK